MNDSPYTNPAEAFTTLLQHFWADRASDDEPLQQWERFCQSKPEGAYHLMAGVDAFAADPPRDGIAQLASRHGYISLRHADGTAYSESEQVEWLRHFASRVRTVYDAVRNSPPAVLADAMHRFWLLPVEPPEEAWAEFARTQPAEAEALLERLESIAADPPDGFAGILQTWGGVKLSDHGVPADERAYVDWFRAELAARRVAAA